MYTLDPVTKELVVPSGDTVQFLLKLTDLDGNPLIQPIDGVAVFAVCEKSTRGTFSPFDGRKIDIVDNTVTVRLPNKFTRRITQGNYYWDIRIVTDPEIDDDGNVTAEDDTDEVHSLFAGTEGGMPKYTVPGVAIDV